MAKLERFRRLCAHTSVCLLAALSLVQTVNAEACAAGGRINFLLGPSEGGSQGGSHFASHVQNMITSTKMN